MIVGACRIELRLAENHSLKGKRRVVQSLCARLRQQFGVAAAEVEDQDAWQRVVIGLSCVSNQSNHARQILEKAVQYIEEERLDAELSDYQIELVEV